MQFCLVDAISSTFDQQHRLTAYRYRDGGRFVHHSGVHGLAGLFLDTAVGARNAAETKEATWE